MRTNYHTHNELCGHAGGTLEEYVRRAMELEFTELGMSDHLPFPGDGFGMRMRYEQLGEYVQETNRLKGTYKDSLRIFLGAEGEYFPDYDKYYERLLTKQGFDYLILGQHFYRADDFACANVYNDMHCTEDIIKYVESSLEGMATGYFAYWAHPDLFFVNDFEQDIHMARAFDIILHDSVKHDYILEWNANGLRREKTSYPAMSFWKEVAKTDIRVIIGADCHSTDALVDGAGEKSEKMTRELGLNVIEKLDIGE